MPQYSFILNGKKVTVDCPGDLRVLWVLNDLLGVRGPKYGCGVGVCQACTCHINGKAFNACSVPISQIKPTDKVTTIEGLAASVGKPLHPVQQAWLDHDVAQCGYCQPGQIMAATALLRDKKNPTDADIDSFMQGNLCRCGTYVRIRAAIKSAAKALNGSAS